MMSYIRRGLGASSAPLSTQIESSAASSLLSVAPYTGPAAPFVAAAGAIASFLAAFGVGSGCGQSCVLSTQFANAAAQALQTNLDDYFAIPAPRTQSEQATALQNYQTVWNTLTQQCSNPSLGSAGQACISDRQAGSCKWKAQPPQYPGQPATGSCWNWDAAYRAPIASDPVVPDATAAASSVASSLTSSPVAGIPSWMLFAGAALGLWALTEVMS